MIAVFSVRKLIKKIIIIIIVFSICFTTFKTILYAAGKSNIENNKIIEFGLPKIDNEKINFELGILKQELVKIEEIEYEEIEEIIPKDEIIHQEKVKTINKNVATEVIKNNIKENPNTNIKGVKIKNETKFELNENIIDNSIKFSNKNVLIFHTHTCESYTPTEKMNYVATGNFRTTDLNYSVSRVGDELEKYLNEYGFNVIHNKEKHDYPAYSGSYNRSLKTVSNIIKNNNDFSLVFDLHRDAIGSNSGYAPKVKIGDEYCAQLMFVIGSNQGGLNHPDWIKNLSYAIKIQEKANEMFPGLFKTMIVRNSRYNQHLNNGASIIEVGATGNTLEECLNSMKYLSCVLNELY